MGSGLGGELKRYKLQFGASHPPRATCQSEKNIPVPAQQSVRVTNHTLHLLCNISFPPYPSSVLRTGLIISHLSSSVLIHSGHQLCKQYTDNKIKRPSALVELKTEFRGYSSAPLRNSVESDLSVWLRSQPGLFYSVDVQLTPYPSFFHPLLFSLDFLPYVCPKNKAAIIKAHHSTLK